MKEIDIIGTGMGNRATMTVEGYEALSRCDFFIGSTRLVEEFQNLKIPCVSEVKTDKIVDSIQAAKGKKIAVLMSGDTGFYSGAKKLAQYFLEPAMAKKYRVKIYPGISSVSYFASKLGRSWEKWGICSMHGEKSNYLAELQKKSQVFLLTGGNIPEILETLQNSGYEEARITIGENLGSEKERIFSGSVQECMEQDFGTLSVMLMEVSEEKRGRLSGISDDEFTRNQTPMTKSEVRAVTLSRLAIRETDICYDIGAGTGSVSIEMAYAATNGTVYSLEKKEEALSVLETNKRKFGCDNMQLIPGEALEEIKKLPAPNVAFFGGTGGNLEGILRELLKKSPNVHMVFQVISLQSLGEVLEMLEKYPIKNVEISQIQVSRGKKAGRHQLMEALNPVYIIVGDGDIYEY